MIFKSMDVLGWGQQGEAILYTERQRYFSWLKLRNFVWQQKQTFLMFFRLDFKNCISDVEFNSTGAVLYPETCHALLHLLAHNRTKEDTHIVSQATFYDHYRYPNIRENILLFYVLPHRIFKYLT